MIIDLHKRDYPVVQLTQSAHINYVRHLFCFLKRINIVENTPLRTAVIGLGMGRSHAEGYTLSPNAELVALCDTDPKRLQENGVKYNVDASGLYDDYKTMFAKANLDMVSICLPNALHAKVSIEAMKAGIHVICEKPMATTVKEAQSMLDASKRTEKRLMVMYNRRYRADAFWIQQLIQNGKLGEVYQLSVNWRRETGIPGWGWAGNEDVAGGGSLIDLGVHVIDLGMWLLGFPEVKTVSGSIRTKFGQHGLKTWGLDPKPREFGVEDGAVGFIRLENNIIMSVQASWAEHIAPNEDRIYMEILGTKGSVVLDIPNYTRKDTLRFYTEVEGVPTVITPRIKWGEVGELQQLVMDAVERLINDEPAPTTAEEGLKAVQIMESFYKSAQDGREISLA